MVTRRITQRKAAGRPRKRSARKVDSALKDSLDGLRDALDLTLTRVIEDDMKAEEAQAVLRYLEKELDGFEKRIRPARSRGQASARGTAATRKTRRTRER